ncbi:MAG: hypothetical protein ACFFBE_07650 [Promethearchaeota archaeon]
MSLEKLERKYQAIIENSYESSEINLSERDSGYSQLIIPFSKIFKSCQPRDIYSGNEKIPFNKKHSHYKMILKAEFLTC